MDISDCMREEIRIVTLNRHAVRTHTLWLVTDKAGIQKELQPYCSFRDEITIIDGIAMRGRKIIMPAILEENTKTAA